MDNQNRELTPVEQAKLTLLKAEEKQLLAMTEAYKQVIEASRPIIEILTVSTVEYSPTSALEAATAACANRLWAVQNLIKYINGELPF
ncbi:hypothetical protein MUN82_04030 [Hymenobacter aerilatus]|uniref:Uncharacterized protein n=1 Tax=Hymenobacter aerilatus TaxID=2932251 RepID=A0A8T9SW29_9BACT|nr:hypothetical protein [Hymenobacter aerilatus]UOR06268.1 hypothetical protein MUN82_04030 [Hymenobacter aerilatus]